MKKTLLSLGLMTASLAYSQSTFSTVYSTLQSSCALGCHSGGNPSAQLDLSGTETDVYNALVNVDPVNPTALAKGDKLVKPGHTTRSFLLRKCDGNLESGEGNLMPTNGSLSDAEVALMESWILYGAPQTGEVVDYSLIQDYYGGLGLVSQVEPMTPPDPSEGFQIYLGAIYVPQYSEAEYFIKHDPNLSEDTEVVGIDVDMNDQSHHFLMYKFNEGTAGTISDGLRLLGTEDSDDVTSLVAAWQFDREINLPENTAYFWEQGGVLDLNYHFVNYSQDSILKVEMYANVYTQSSGTAEKEMFSDLILYPPLQFFLPADGQEHVFNAPVYDANSDINLNVWMLSSHTHKYGKDYDIFKRNSDGSRGEQIYEGFYNTDYTTNMGTYDWEHPAIRYFEPFETIDYRNGFIHEAKFNNTGNSDVYFNVTTEDEMMLFFIQYTADLIDNVNELEKSSLKLFPNPLDGGEDLMLVFHKNEEVLLEMYGLSGQLIFRKAYSVIDGVNKIERESFGEVKSGLYTIRILSNDQSYTSKVIIK